MSETTFALVDCNNFYASCEKLFRPDLVAKPVVVLSNNDGCVIARSKEAKALGIKMGVPLFKIRHLIEMHHIQTFSSNYALYADMSARVMQTLEEMAPAVEIYSIDEAFLDLTGLEASSNLAEFGYTVRQRIQQWIGLTVCVGIAPTKTLAKLANHAAKEWSKTGGVVDLTSKERQRKLMALLPVNEVWGIGSKLSKRLETMGIHTALQLADAPPKLIRQQFSVVVERTVQELNSEPCLTLEDIPATKKEIVSSRAFGERVTDKQQMHQAVAEYVHRACSKLRSEGCQAKQISVFIRTSPFSDFSKDPYYTNSTSAELTYPSDDTRDFLIVAAKLLDRIWKDGYRYAKAGVMLSDFYAHGIYQQDLFTTPKSAESNSVLMTLMDRINEEHPNSLFFGSKGTVQDWKMKREQLSPSYTTSWDGLAKAR
ncbi:translesion error-prone DNA polymerase V subunit UmuC [Rheinheimera aquimaris]|uniref:translesion error-prone DNA polymerase V subunit UmuC n=1 Tax=Rheinheimera aquimaris TaxID=412437 RepID=UPI0010669A4D|nr:translesion error-prone DNA polymerase V subunit UmuC [Rheinheimera aquimaris]